MIGGKDVDLARVRALVRARQSDRERWLEPENLRNWDERARRVATFLSKGQTIIDLGCGSMTIRNLLPAGCTYIPADIVKRCEDCRLIDLNEGIWPDETADVVTALGVLEYLYDLRAFFQGCARMAPRLLFSYHVSYTRKPATRTARLAMGWLNDFPLSLVIAEIAKAGGKIDRIDGFMHKNNYTQYLFVVQFPAQKT